KDTFHSCGYNLYWYCYSGNCGYQRSIQRGQIDHSYNGSPTRSTWCETAAVERIHIPTDKPFEIRAASCCWISTDNFIGSWRLLTSVDLGTRSDTKEPNNSPDVAIIPFLRLPQNCRRSYSLMSFDQDGDQVRCRYGSVQNIECSRCQQPPGFSLDQGSCTLHYQSASTAPLSKLPLQFSFLVDPPVASCRDGDYLPKLIYPTPENGARLNAEVNKEVEIRVKAQASYSTINDILISGPLNISKHRTTHDEFVIKWTPIPDDLGEFFPVCFAVESVNRGAVYQSEMRCVLVKVGREQVKTNVICHESTMTVEVDKSTFFGLHEDHLRLIDPSNTACSLQTHSNSTHVKAVIPLNACGTEIEEDDDNLIFKNEITAFDTVRDIIARHHLLEVQFYCQYPKRGNVTVGFTAHRRNVTVWEKGFGTFTYNFEFFPNIRYDAMFDPNLYPLEFDIGTDIFMQIQATSSVNNTELFVESCRAAPYDNPNSSPTYSIIENGCNVDPTLQIHSPLHLKYFRFSVEAFKFIGFHDQVFISCSVLVCEAGNPNTRCFKGCTNSSNSRQKREAVIQTAMHFVSQGPLRLRRSAESRELTKMNSLNLNMVFIIGCLLVVVGMICAVVVYKSRMPKVKYQPVPVSED
ncbi:hypothetical protein LDENG_00012860, partial [Lucifuga dentata]